MKNDINENKALSQTSVSGSLSKNQMKHFVRIFIGSTSFFNDFGLEEVEKVDEGLIENLLIELSKQARKILKEDRAFTNTKEIFEYVQQNYR